MASIERRTTKKGVKYDVRYRTPTGQMRKRSFGSRAEAKRWAAAVETDKARGDWLDPNRGKRTFDAWADEWLVTRAHLKPKTMLSYEALLRVHVRPYFGPRPVTSIDHADVLRFLTGLRTARSGPDTIANVRNVLRGVLDLAVRSGAIKANPAAGMRVARPRREEMAFLTADQVRDLADAIENPGPPKSGGGEHRRATFPELGLLVRFAAYTGLRAGEIGALRVGDIDLFRRRAHVRASLADVNGHLVFGATKTYETRSVPLPSGLLDELVRYLAGRDVDDLVWRGANGRPLRHGSFYRHHFKPAVTRAGLPETLRFHDLRHTYAALCIAEGADAFVLKGRLGHSTITVTYDRYGHLLPERDEQLTDALDATYKAARGTKTAPVCAINVP